MWGIKQCCDLPVCLSVCLSHIFSSTTVHLRAVVITLIGGQWWKSNPLVNVAVWTLELVEMATNLLQKHSLGVCTIDRALCWLQTWSICTVCPRRNDSSWSIWFRRHPGDTLLFTRNLPIYIDQHTHDCSAFDNRMTLTFDLSTLLSMHA